MGGACAALGVATPPFAVNSTEVVIIVGVANEVGVVMEGSSGMLSTLGKELKRFSRLSGLFFNSVGIENLLNRKLGRIF